jgi:hypothetical protein
MADRRSPIPEREAFLEEIRRTKEVFYKTVVAQAQKIEVVGDRIIFTFLPIHRMQREKVEDSRNWLEPMASTLGGRKISVSAAQAEQVVEPGSSSNGDTGGPAAPKPVDLRASAMSDVTVQAMLDVFPAEIEDVEEI